MKKLVIASMVMVIIAVFTITGARAGSLEPSGPPGSTMHDLNSIHSTVESIWWGTNPKIVWRIQTLNFLDDWGSNPLRWAIANNDTPGDTTDDIVWDKETGLMWPRNANIANGTKTWEEALTYCPNLTIGGRKGWRLPTREELASLVDPSQNDPALPAHPFINVPSSHYWSSTTYESSTDFAWLVHMGSGIVYNNFKSFDYYVWPVRGGSGPILVPHTP